MKFRNKWYKAGDAQVLSLEESERRRLQKNAFFEERLQKDVLTDERIETFDQARKLIYVLEQLGASEKDIQDAMSGDGLYVEIKTIKMSFDTFLANSRKTFANKDSTFWLFQYVSSTFQRLPDIIKGLERELAWIENTPARELLIKCSQFASKHGKQDGESDTPVGGHKNFKYEKGGLKIEVTNMMTMGGPRISAKVWNNNELVFDAYSNLMRPTECL